MDNTEKNIKVALWLGFQKTSIGWYDSEEVLVEVEKGGNTFDILKFDTDWNWLVELVKVIYEKANSFVGDEYCEEDSRFIVIIKDALQDVSIQGVFDACVDFIDSLEEIEIESHR